MTGDQIHQVTNISQHFLIICYKRDSPFHVPLPVLGSAFLLAPSVVFKRFSRQVANDAVCAYIDEVQGSERKYNPTRNGVRGQYDTFVSEFEEDICPKV